MTVTHARLVYGAFELDLDGSEQFVAAQLAAFAGRIPAQIRATAPAADAPKVEDLDLVPKDELEKPEKKRPRKASSGPSCASRILPLVAEGFFDAPKVSSVVVEKLREKATPYSGKHVAAAMAYLTQSGKLRRMQQGGVWQYVKP